MAKKTGRKPKEIDPEEVKKLAAIQCSVEEIADFFDVSKKTIERRFGAAIKTGRSTGKTSLKRQQYIVAMKGNVTMLIWLGKQYLGQKEKSTEELENDRENRIQAYYISEKERKEIAAKSTEELQKMFQSKLNCSSSYVNFEKEKKKQEAGKT